MLGYTVDDAQPFVVSPSTTLRAGHTYVAGEGDSSFTLRNIGFYLFLFVSLFMPGRTFSAESQNLTVVSYPARPAKLPLWLAQDAGLFEKNGLKVSIKELNSSEELIQ